MQTLVNLFGRQAASWMRSALLGVAAASKAPASPRDWYDVLQAYYEANGLYQILRDAGAAAGLSGEALRAIRNPAFRATEFHASHLWPGSLPDALPIVTENERIVESIQDVWTWSNWGAKKQVVARRLPMLGDWFCKVMSDADAGRVWFQNLEPRYVTDFSKDDRGFITYIRIDVPQITTDSAGMVTERWSHVEAWDKALGTYRQWRHLGDSVNVSLEQLGTPVVNEPLTSFGVDFIPIVHAPFRDVGDNRGVGCFVPVIDKIDEVNRIATRLHQMGFRNMRNVWASLRTGTDAQGRPLPGVKLGDAMKDGETKGTLSVLSEETFVDLPGSTDLKSLVPDLKYADLLEIVRDHMGEIAADLPEIMWYSLAERGADLSSRAIRLLMAPAVARVEEGRGNAETALVRLDQMALTIGQAIGVFDQSIGSYDGGDFDHHFEARDVLPLSDIDEAEAELRRAQAAQAYAAAGVPAAIIAQRALGMTDEQATEMLGMMASQVAGGPAPGVAQQ
jgi:hypothetical protein